MWLRLSIAIAVSKVLTKLNSSYLYGIDDTLTSTTCHAIRFTQFSIARQFNFIVVALLFEHFFLFVLFVHDESKLNANVCIIIYRCRCSAALIFIL